MFKLDTLHILQAKRVLQQKSSFIFYNLFLDVILIQNMVNVFLIAQICVYTIKMSAQEYISEVEKTLLYLVSHLEIFVLASAFSLHCNSHLLYLPLLLSKSLTTNLVIASALSFHCISHLSYLHVPLLLSKSVTPYLILASALSLH